MESLYHRPVQAGSLRREFRPLRARRRFNLSPIKALKGTVLSPRTQQHEQAIDNNKKGLPKWLKQAITAAVLVPTIATGAFGTRAAWAGRHPTQEAFPVVTSTNSAGWDVSEVLARPEVRVAAGAAALVTVAAAVKSSSTPTEAASFVSAELPSSTAERQARLDRLYEEVERLKRRQAKLWAIALKLMEEDKSLDPQTAALRAAESMGFSRAEAPMAAAAALATQGDFSATPAPVRPGGASARSAPTAVASPAPATAVTPQVLPMRPSGGASRSAPAAAATAAPAPAPAQALDPVSRPGGRGVAVRNPFAPTPTAPAPSTASASAAPAAASNGKVPTGSAAPAAASNGKVPTSVVPPTAAKNGAFNGSAAGLAKWAEDMVASVARQTPAAIAPPAAPTPAAPTPAAAPAAPSPAAAPAARAFDGTQGFGAVEKVHELLSAVVATEEFKQDKYDPLRDVLSDLKAPTGEHKYDLVKGLLREVREADRAAQQRMARKAVARQEAREARAAAKAAGIEKPSPTRPDLLHDLLWSLRQSADPNAILLSSDPKYDPVWSLLKMQPMTGLAKYDCVGQLLKAALEASPQPSAYDPLALILKATPPSGTAAFDPLQALLKGSWQNAPAAGLQDLPAWDLVANIKEAAKSPSGSRDSSPSRQPVSKYDLIGQVVEGAAALPEELASGRFAQRNGRDPINATLQDIFEGGPIGLARAGINAISAVTGAASLQIRRVGGSLSDAAARAAAATQASIMQQQQEQQDAGGSSSGRNLFTAVVESFTDKQGTVTFTFGNGNGKAKQDVSAAPIETGSGAAAAAPAPAAAAAAPPAVVSSPQPVVAAPSMPAAVAARAPAPPAAAPAVAAAAASAAAAVAAKPTASAAAPAFSTARQVPSVPAQAAKNEAAKAGAKSGRGAMNVNISMSGAPFAPAAPAAAEATAPAGAPKPAAATPAAAAPAAGVLSSGSLRSMNVDIAKDIVNSVMMLEFYRVSDKDDDPAIALNDRAGGAFHAVMSELSAVRHDKALLKQHTAVARLLLTAAEAAANQQDAPVYSLMYDKQAILKEAEAGIPAFLSAIKASQPSLYAVLNATSAESAVAVLCTLSAWSSRNDARNAILQMV